MSDTTHLDRRPGCPDDEALGALAAGEATDAVRSELVAHLAGCARCRGVVASLALAFANPAVAAARTSTTTGSRRWVARLAVPAAAAAVLLVALLARPTDRPPATSLHRATESNAGETPVPISPRGSVGRPDVLRWGAVAGAARYRVTLYNSDGQMIYRLELPDTVTPLPDSVPLTPGQLYLWKVDARTGWDRWTGSEMVRFTFTEREP